MTTILKCQFISILLILLNWKFIQQVHAITPQSRGDQNCVYMSTAAKIFCYGGQWYGPGDDEPITAVVGLLFFSLDLSHQRSIGDIQNAWERINSDVGPNAFFGMTAVPSQKLIFMNGGAGGRSSSSAVQTPVRYKSATFNIESTDGWSEVIPEQSGTAVNCHTATLGPDNNTIYIWGGVRDGDTGIAPGEEAYPLQMLILDLRNKESPWTTGAAVDSSYQFQSAVLVGSSIYYIGGTYTSEELAVPMDSVRIYNTENGQWSSRPVTGSVMPTTRVRHTATLKPNTEEIILFGGRGPGSSPGLRNDYFYVLDTQSHDMTWRNATIQSLGDSFSPVEIYGHSAIMAGSQLYIMFGFTTDGTILDISTNRTWVMDVSSTDINQWGWVSSINAIQAEPLPTSTQTPDPTSEPDKKTSVNPGTIAGAVVGGVAGLAIVAGVAFFFIRKKRRQPQQESKEVYNNNESNQQYDMYSSDDHPPPPKYYGELERNSSDGNITQPLSPATHYFKDNGGSGFDRPSVDYTDNSTSQGLSSSLGFHTPEKPDGSVQRFVMSPVKPDGA